MTTPAPRDAVYRAAARAYCLDRFNYGAAATYVDGEAGRQLHIDNDARGTADESWLRAIVDAALDAAREDAAA